VVYALITLFLMTFLSGHWALGVFLLGVYLWYAEKTDEKP